jgi:Septum formation
MSTEATGDGTRDAVDQVEQEMAACQDTGAGDTPVTDTKTGEAGHAGQAAAPGVADEAADGNDYGENPDQGSDRDSDGDLAQRDGDLARRENDERYEDGDYPAADEDEDFVDDAEDTDAEDTGTEDTDDRDAPPEPVEFAEPAELDQPATALRRPRLWTRVLITLGFVIVAAAVVGGAFAVVRSVTHGFKKPVKVTYKKSAVFSLKTGDCFDPQGQAYTLIPCDSAHQAEVFATFPLAGTTWPGTTAVSAAASSGCATRLTGYLNPQLAISLASTYVYPDATAWQAGTRTVICEVRAASGDLTGSVRGASATAG